MIHKTLPECYLMFSVQSKKCFLTGGFRKYATSQEPKPFKSIPGLSSLPYLGPIHHFLPIIGQFGPKANIFDVAETLYKQFGPIVRLAGVFARADMVMLFEPQHIDQVYRSQESNPLRPGFETMEYYRGVIKKSSFEGIYGLTTAQGPKWREFRTKVNPALLKIKLVKVYTPALEEIAKDLIERLKTLKDDKSYIQNNFRYELDKWSLESVAYVGLGTRLGCLTDEMTDDHTGTILMKCAKDIIDFSFELEFLPNPWKYISTPAFKKLMKSYDLQWNISTKCIEQAREQINKRGHDILDEDKSIIEKLLAIDEKVAIVMANEMLFAGIDTVTFATTSILYHLAVNPEKQEKLRQEIRSGEPSKRYLKACLKEALRIWHVVPANLRRTDKDHYVGGYHIPKGIDVIAPNQFLSNMEKYYPRPKEFIPERWLADKTDPLYYGNAHPMITLPFGFGIRSCIGRRIAELEIEIVISRIIDEFKLKWDGPPITVVNKVTNSFAPPYNFKFETAK